MRLARTESHVIKPLPDRMGKKEFLQSKLSSRC